MRRDGKENQRLNSSWAKTEYNLGTTMLTTEYSGKTPGSMVEITRMTHTMGLIHTTLME